MPSSVIEQMEYEPVGRVLTIGYRGGRGVYRYFEVPMEEWVAFVGSGAKGNYLNDVFKGKGYRFERVMGEVEWKGALRWPVGSKS